MKKILILALLAGFCFGKDQFFEHSISEALNSKFAEILDKNIALNF